MSTAGIRSYLRLRKERGVSVSQRKAEVRAFFRRKEERKFTCMPDDAIILVDHYGLD